MFNAQWVMLKGWLNAGCIQGEKLHACASSESTNCKPSYRIRERPLVRPKISVKSASCFRARRHPAGRRKHFARFQILVFIS